MLSVILIVLTIFDILALDIELLIHSPSTDISKLPPSLLQILDTDLIPPIGQPPRKPSHLRPHHPQSPGPACDVEQVF